MNIRPATAADMPALFDHTQTHFAESGKDGDLIFHPIDDFTSWTREDFVKRAVAGLEAPLGSPGWSRSWICELGGQIVADATVRSARLASASHRCQFAIGVQRLARGQGLGRRLSLAALNWCRQQSGLEWVDLWVMAHNEPAIALYQSLGFRPIATVPDQFRLHGRQIADLQMALPLAR